MNTSTKRKWEIEYTMDFGPGSLFEEYVSSAEYYGREGALLILTGVLSFLWVALLALVVYGFISGTAISSAYASFMHVLGVMVVIALTLYLGWLIDCIATHSAPLLRWDVDGKGKRQCLDECARALGFSSYTTLECSNVVINGLKCCVSFDGETLEFKAEHGEPIRNPLPAKWHCETERLLIAGFSNTCKAKVEIPKWIPIEKEKIKEASEIQNMALSVMEVQDVLENGPCTFSGSTIERLTLVVSLVPAIIAYSCSRLTRCFLSAR